MVMTYTKLKDLLKTGMFISVALKVKRKTLFKNKLFKEQPYPKGVNKNYDASYNPNTQTTLF
jgi:hypothetical protein